MKSTVGRWGNSLALRLPKSVADDAGLLEGANVEFQVEDGRLIVTPARPIFRIEELMAAYDPALHHHEEVEWGHPVGDETW
ncbi:MAG: AbrB/MazE/SpoVT family DNA-binding domain-containing protein [Aliidongia sp.]